MEYFRDHIIETCFAVIVTLLGIIGKVTIDGIRTDVQNLECSVSVVTVNSSYERIELALLGTTIDDLKIDSDYIKDLDKLKNDFEKPLSHCKRGIRQLKWIIALKSGLSKYLSKDYEKAIKEFDKLEVTNSLNQYLLGAAKFHLINHEIYNIKEEKKLKLQISNHLENSIQLASERPASTATFRTVKRLRCISLMVNQNKRSNIAAIDCLKEIIMNKNDTHNTYYNLAALHSREKNFQESLNNLELCLKHEGAIYISKYEIEADKDMKNLLEEESISDRTQAIIAKFK